jgi:putative CocE/NonD family hydrolase
VQLPSRLITARALAVALAFPLVAPVGPRALGAQAPAAATDSIFDRVEAMIPTRDGVRLYTQIYAPRGASEKLPIMFLRTPYGIGGWSSPRVAMAFKELADDGYIFVFQDARGRFKSEGQFVMMRQPRDPKDKKAIDESTDTYDSIEWLLKNVPNNNGRVGMMGVSYGGWLTAMGMLDPHPALKAVSPQASPADMWLGDDFHHNGAFRLSYGFEYAYMMESSKEMTDARGAIPDYDSYEWYLRQGALSNITDKVVKGKLPTWRDFSEHADYDAFWQRQGFAPWLDKVTVPTLNVAGWWDQEDFYGPLKIYELLEKHDANNQNFLVVGPWNHGGWSSGPGDHLGDIKFGSETAEYYRKNIQAPFFAYYLKGKGTLDLPEALTFRTGDNTWVRHDHWPPKQNVTDRRLYFHGNGKLSFDAPREPGDEQFDSYISDPAKPVPYRPRPIPTTYDSRGSGWSTWLLGDQRFVDGRPDVLTWQSDVLTDDVVVSGDIVAHLFASTSGTDSDWIVKLIDVYPSDVPDDPKMGGFQLMVANDVMRGRYRNSYEKPEPIPPDQPQPYTVDLHGNDHTFRKGHRIMVQVQSSWFPLIDRNPQKFVPNIYKAKDTDFQRAVQRIFRSGKRSSFIALPVVEPVRQ